MLSSCTVLTVSSRTKVEAAYGELLHRIWIDNPNYFDDVIAETDEFDRLDSLLNGKWRDVFEFRNEDERKLYLLNCR